jgi:signal transduction histidine kinase/CheY-like chemotaxis protein
VVRPATLVRSSQAMNDERSLFMQAPVAICVLEGPRHTFVFANDHYRALVGGREVEGKTLLEALPDLADQGYDKLLDEVKATGKTFYGTEAEVRFADVTKYMNFTYSAKTSSDGVVDGVLVSAVDVTEQVRARQNLRNERDKLETIFEASPAAMALWRGRDLVFEKVNSVYQSIYGARPLLGLPITVALPELIDQPFIELLERVFDTGEPVRGREALGYVTRTTGGPLQARYWDYTYDRVDGADGTPYGVYCHSIDVTDRVLARKDAEHANRTKDEFLAMLGHELRNPLAPIKTALELMRMRGDTAFTKERTVIERQVDHLSRLVDDLLDVSRITSGKVHLNLKWVNLSDVVKEALEIASPLLEQRQQHLTIDVPQADLVVEGDETRLAQVLSNILTNASKYTPQGGRVDIRAREEGESIVITVRDNGIGISEAMLPRVFELFSQESQSIERSQGGLGLGLAIVRTLTEMHGGKASVESAGKGQGSTFTIRLPKRVQDSLERTTVAADSMTRILIVDDNEDASEALAKALRARQYEVRIAHDGPEALAIAKTFQPQVAVLDVNLPVMDGYELGKRIKHDAPGTRLLAMTAYGNRARDHQDGVFDAYLQRPVGWEQVIALLSL